MDKQEKKQYTTPQISELGQVNDFVQTGGLYGAIDGTVVTIYGVGYSPHSSY
jgi:hypothetical protein